MERTLEGHDHAGFGRTALRGGPFAHQLDRGLVGLGAGIAEEYALGERRVLDQLLGQPQRGLGVEHVAGVPELVRLRHQRGDEIGVLVAERVHRDAGAEVEVITTLRIPHPGALAVVEHDVARTVHRQPVTLAQADEIGGIDRMRRHGTDSRPRPQHRNPYRDGWNRTVRSAVRHRSETPAPDAAGLAGLAYARVEPASYKARAAPTTHGM